MSGLTSGTTSWTPALSETLIEAFERCGMPGSALTQEHLVSGRRSLNFVLSRWSNRGINLWKVSLVQTYMPQGQATYSVDPATINVLDTYLRQWQMGAGTNLVPGFATAAGSPVVTITLPGQAPVAGNFVNIIVPVSIGGIVVQGFYEVQSVTSGSVFTIAAASNATATASGGLVPAFTTAAGSAAVSVNLLAHGYLAGQTFAVQIQTSVGGVTLLGDYTIVSITNANNFVITAANVSGYTQAAFENGGSTSISVQSSVNGYTQSSDPTDLLLYPLSRNDYAAVPDKLQQGRPTSFWFDRLNSPTITLWPVPDGNGPYQLCYYAFTRVFDAVPEGGQVGDMPQRFYEAYVAEVAAHIAQKWAPQRAQPLYLYASQVFAEAQAEDREKVSTYLVPNFAGYFGNGG